MFIGCCVGFWAASVGRRFDTVVIGELELGWKPLRPILVV